MTGRISVRFRKRSKCRTPNRQVDREVDFRQEITDSKTEDAETEETRGSTENRGRTKMEELSQRMLGVLEGLPL